MQHTICVSSKVKEDLSHEWNKLYAGAYQVEYNYTMHATSECKQKHVQVEAESTGIMYSNCDQF